MNKNGFTLIEMIVSVVLLSVAILALSTSTTRLVGVTMDAETKALALQAVEDRLAEIRLHPIYQQIDSLFTESNTAVPNMQGYRRSTSITRVLQEGDRDGKYIDFTRITVEVTGPQLSRPLSRSISIGVF